MTTAADGSHFHRLTASRYRGECVTIAYVDLHDLASVHLDDTVRIQTLGTVILARERLQDAAFFVGAGVSVAAPSQIESPVELVRASFDVIIAHVRSHVAGRYLESLDEILDAARTAGVPDRIGFEVFFRAIAAADRDAMTAVFASLHESWESVFPNDAHRALAAALAAGGVVITTNYDELIERAAHNAKTTFTTVCDEAAAEAYVRDLGPNRPTSLIFKVHGTISRPDTCLGALQDVGVEFAGARRELLRRILKDRFPFFVGWRGADPDLAPVFTDLVSKERPFVWTAYEGADPGKFTLASVTEGLPYTTQLLIARSNLVVSEASRLLSWMYPEVQQAYVPSGTPRSAALTELENRVSAWSRTRTLAVLGDLLVAVGNYSLARDVAALREEVEEAAPYADRPDVLQWVRGLNAVFGADVVKGFDAQMAGQHDTSDSASPGDSLRSSLFAILRSDLGEDEKFFWMLEVIEASAWTSWPGFMLSALLAPILRRSKREDDFWTFIVESLRGRVRVRVVGRAGRYSRSAARWAVEPYTRAVAAVSRALDNDVEARAVLLEHYIRARMYRLLATAIVGDGGVAFDNFYEVDRLVSLSGAASLQYNWNAWRPLILRWAQDNRTAPLPFAGFRS